VRGRRLRADKQRQEYYDELLMCGNAHRVLHCQGPANARGRKHSVTRSVALESQRRGRDEAFDGFPDELDVHDLGHAVRCTKCGRRGGPSAHAWAAHLRRTGQRHRLPYWTPLMREEDERRCWVASEVASAVRDGGFIRA
jgi:hypothetical protein